MSTRDLYHNMLAKQSLRPEARTASENGTGVDTAGYESATALIDVGAWTDGVHTFQVEESDDDATYTAVADADLRGSEPVVDAADDDDQIYEIGYFGDKPYLRVAVIVSGSPTTGAVYSAEIVLGHPHDMPTK